jgi:hypothetical protein
VASTDNTEAWNMKLLSCLVTAGLLSALPALALAQSEGAPNTPEPRQPASAGDEGKTEPKKPATKTETTQGYQGRHDVKGEITNVNKDTGMLSLKTAEGDLQLAFPPSAVNKLNKGDEVSVEMAIKTLPKAEPKTPAKP